MIERRKQERRAYTDAMVIIAIDKYIKNHGLQGKKNVLEALRMAEEKHLTDNPSKVEIVHYK